MRSRTSRPSGRIGTITTVDEARKAHHLATADPEPERGDGVLTGPAHEEKYGLERAEGSAALWRAAGVHPTENRALVGDEDGAENVRGAVAAAAPKLETATVAAPPENTSVTSPVAHAGAGAPAIELPVATAAQSASSPAEVATRDTAATTATASRTPPAAQGSLHPAPRVSAAPAPALSAPAASRPAAALPPPAPTVEGRSIRTGH